MSIFHVCSGYFLRSNYPATAYTYSYGTTTTQQRPTISEQMMKRLDEDKASLVEVMRSIKFRQHTHTHRSSAMPTHLAQLDPHARQAHTDSPEDCSLVRSAN